MTALSFEPDLQQQARRQAAAAAAAAEGCVLEMSTRAGAKVAVEVMLVGLDMTGGGGGRNERGG